MVSIIQLHALDNVRVCKAELPAGTSLVQPELTLLDTIPAMHKVALRDIANGEEIRKYGQPIGVASADIRAGEHVHSHNCQIAYSKKSDKDYAFCRDARPTELVPLEQRGHVDGFRRANGKVGTRNYIGILTTVNCSATVARALRGLQSFPISVLASLDGRSARLDRHGWRKCRFCRSKNLPVSRRCAGSARARKAL